MNHSTYMPHGWCLQWNPQLLMLMVSANLLTAVAYFSIPLQLILFARRRKDLDIRLNRTLVLFAAFIAICGISHLASIWTIWHPDYWPEAWLTFATGVISSIAATRLIPALSMLMHSDTLDSLREQITELSKPPMPIHTAPRVVPSVSDQQIIEAISSLEDLEFRLRLREAAIQYARDPIVVTRMSRNPLEVEILLVNQSYCRLVGFPETDLVGKPPADTLAGPLTDLQEWARTNEELFAGHTCVGKGVLYLQYGPTWVEWSSAPIPTLQGDKMQYCAVSVLRIIGPANG